MAVKLHRRISPRGLALCAIVLTVLLCIYYASNSSVENEVTEKLTNPEPETPIKQDNYKQTKIIKHPVCPHLNSADADVNTVDVFKDFDFQPAWMKMKEYWDKPFEDRYERQKMDTERPPLKVIIIPHSHNDPGWLKTFENYFHYQSRQIMNNMVTKLQQHKNLTFIWSEIAFLNAWWEVAHPSKQRALKNLVQSGRLEITTGGWVMTDEANSHVYAMVDQLIEGHQWVISNLGVKPKSGWSIDPFGHGSTQPYLLASSGITGTVIQRIHYAWKQWLALKQYGDFRWIPNWSPSDPSGTILTHNQPFDIYSIKHSCGPHPYVCLNFDFRKIPGEFTEYSVKAQAINDINVKEKSELLLEQYARTGSLFPHNVVLMPLGDDFRYNVLEEWDQQYNNYIKLVNYINAHKDIYKAEISFGTPKDYFDEILRRYDQFPTLKGDFFVYSDIFSEGRPAYWSGYFTTRPFMKILDRDLEHSLRTAEILYTIGINNARFKNFSSYLKVLERDYERLILARRNLGLFQHHDAITGTSKSFVMRDYGLKLFESLRDTLKIQQNSLQSIMFGDLGFKPDKNVVLSDLERDSYEKLPKTTPIVVDEARSRRVVIFNSLLQKREELVQLRVNNPFVRVTDYDNKEVTVQINPVWNTTDGNAKMHTMSDEYELIFIASIPALSLAIFNISYDISQKNLAVIYCNKCHRNNENDLLISKFTIKNTQSGDIQLENQKLRLLFNGNTGFMKSVMRKKSRKTTQCAIQFAAYKSAQFHSGAYLFMPDPNEHDIEKDVLQQYKDQFSIIITTGPIASQITVIYGPFLVHTVRIFHIDSTINEAIYLENDIDFENPPKNRETELFIRLVTEVQNGEPPEFYTDSNGFSMQKRVKVEKIGIEGNYFPITTMTYIQDDSLRISLLTNHAQGAASFQPGQLELMLDRRTLYDDSRGMGEGVVDNRKTTHKFWLLLEDINTGKLNTESNRFDGNDYDSIRSFSNGNEIKLDFSRPSLFANHLSNNLNYPLSIYILEEGVDTNFTLLRLINHEFPCDYHLTTLRTQPDPVYTQFPSSHALLVLHRQGFMCSISKNYICETSDFKSGTNFNHSFVKKIVPTTLTGLEVTGAPIRELSEININPMALQTFNVTFK